MKTSPGLDAFQNQKIGCTGSQLNIRSTFNRTTVKMRGDLRIVCLSHPSNFFRFKQTAYSSQRHLQNRCGLLFKNTRKFIFGGQSLARGNGNGCLSRNSRHLTSVFRRYWLLKPQGITGFNTFRKTNGARCGELAVRAKQQISPIANCFSQCLDKFL